MNCRMEKQASDKASGSGKMPLATASNAEMIREDLRRRPCNLLRHDAENRISAGWLTPTKTASTVSTFCISHYRRGRLRLLSGAFRL